ncbi:MAG: NAD-dependent epimerase/dehydratase family protein [Pseudomonadota bacterium]
MSGGEPTATKSEQPLSGPTHALDTAICITGAAGLVGQSLVRLLAKNGFNKLRCVDKDRRSLALMNALDPAVELLEGDLSDAQVAERAVTGSEILIIGQAQISGLTYEPFDQNTVVATRHLIEAAKRAGVRHIVLISSSVVLSEADDFYTRSKRAQERMVCESGLPHTVLRPTLMFGDFDRKHLGWLRQFLAKSPVFPVPGDGRFIRQPLYVRDFCAVIASALERPPTGAVYDISGLEKIEYIEIIRTIRRVTGLRTPILRLPYRLFWALLWTAGKVLPRPPFSTQQLEALVIDETFPVIDWPNQFGVTPTPFETAAQQTFGAAATEPTA